MATTFEEMLWMPVEVYDIDGVRAAYIDLRVARSTVPATVHAYELRDTSDDGGWYMGNIEDYVVVNHAGTMFTVEALRMRHPEREVYMDMTEDEPWSVVEGPAGAPCPTLRMFLESEGAALDDPAQGKEE